jgi:two-component system, NtrC family, sensor histidine kinase KinB
MNSLRNKLLLGFGGLLLILVAVSVLTLVVLTRYSRTLESIFHENYNSAVYCEQMKIAIDRLDHRAERLFLNQDLATTQPAVADEFDRFDTNLRLQLGNLTLPGEPELSHHLADLWSEYLKRYQRFIDSPKQLHEEYRTDLQPRYDEIHDVAQRIADMNMSNMVSVDGRVKRTLIGVRNALAILVAAGTLLAAVLVGTVAAALKSPLRTLTQSARQIESGDLDLQIEVKSRDEIGQLAEAFNAMASRLREFRRIEQERLGRSEQTTQLAIDSLPDAVMVISPAGKVEISNRTAQNHFGIHPGEKLADLHLPWLSDAYAQVMWNHKTIESPGYKSAIQLFDNGAERFLLPRTVPIIGPDDRIIGVTVILVDVTLLHHADELKSGLVSTVSHELRTPLTTIRMAIAMSSSEKLGPINDRQRKVLRAAGEDAERLHRIIENLLSMSRLESGKAMQFRAMSADEIVAQAVDPLRAAFAEKSLQLGVDIADHLPTVQADPSCIGLALTNLLSNAQKFTPAGGKVDVHVFAEEDWMNFSVSDSGPGIPDEFTAQIFEKFFRIPRAEGPSGAGLGLSITKEIVEEHGGTISFHTGPNGTGSTFCFKLPLTPVTAAAAANA